MTMTSQINLRHGVTSAEIILTGVPHADGEMRGFEVSAARRRHVMSGVDLAPVDGEVPFVASFFTYGSELLRKCILHVLRMTFGAESNQRRGAHCRERSQALLGHLRMRLNQSGDYVSTVRMMHTLRGVSVHKQNGFVFADNVFHAFHTLAPLLPQPLLTQIVAERYDIAGFRFGLGRGKSDIGAAVDVRNNN